MKRIFLLMIACFFCFSGATFSDSISISSGYINTGSIGEKGSDYVPVIAGGQSSWNAALIAGDYWNAPEAYISRGVLKFDLKPWYGLGLSKDHITAVKLYIPGIGGSSTGFEFDVYSMLDNLETDLTITASSTYYNSEDLTQGAVIENSTGFAINEYIDKDFILNDIVDGYDGITQTTYSGFVMMGYTEEDKFWCYKGIDWPYAPYPTLYIEYSESLPEAVPEPVSFLLLGLGLIGLIKKRFVSNF